MRLLDLVQHDAILVELTATDQKGVVRELVEALARCKAIEESAVDGIVRNILTRERTRGSTGFGKGVAAPHVKLSGLSRAVAALGRSSAGVDFASLDGGLVYCIFLILTPEERPEEHLKAMDVVFRQLQQERFRKFMRASDSREKVLDLLRETDDRSGSGG